MNDRPLSSLTTYSQFLAESVDRPGVIRSTISVWSISPYTAIAEGEVFFIGGIRLRLREELDFDAEIISSYGYEVYEGQNKLYWYDDFPHPNDPTLASSYPHHKHIPPNIKRNRIPAPSIRFIKPNLPFLLDEIITLVKQD